MDPTLNPYAPGAGTPPPELAGRADVLRAAEVALARVAQSRPVQSLVLVGLSGVGKTVLLNRIDQLATDQGFISIFLEAHEGKPLPELMVPSLRRAIYQISRAERAQVLANRALRVLRGFISAFKITIDGVEFGVDPEIGVADSGDLEADLPELLQAVAQAGDAAQTPILILIDELQYLNTSEFSALIMGVHRINQKGLPLIVTAAGLPQILGLAGNAKSYAERLFRFPTVGPLETDDAILAIQGPAEKEGVTFDDTAIAHILEQTQRYPYFLQQWAYEAWNEAETAVIDDAVMKRATAAAIGELDQSFFRVRFDRCTPSEKRYMRALAELGAGKQRSGDVADVLGVKSTSVAPTRSSLIRKGMIYSPAHGVTEFTVPLFDQYMRRAMPDGAR